MEKKLFLDPPLLRRWLPKEQQKNKSMFLELEADFLDEDTIRFDLSIIFHPIAFRRGWVRRADYYVGSTSARITFDTSRGRVSKHTLGIPMKVNYNQSQSRSRKSSVKIAPALEGPYELKANIGEIGFDSNTKSTFTTEFEGAEKELLDNPLGKEGVAWDLAFAGGRAIRDYLIGNLYLFVECSWDGDTKEGTIEVRPSDLSFFDGNRRRIDSPMKSLVMRFILAKRGIPFNDESILISFREA